MNEQEIMAKLQEMSRPERFSLLGSLADIHEILKKMDEPNRQLAIAALMDGLLDRHTMAKLVMMD